MRQEGAEHIIGEGGQEGRRPAQAADPDGENARLVDAYAKAVADADAYDWAVAAAEADVVAGMPEDQQAVDDGGAEDGDTRKNSGRGLKRSRKGSRGKAARTDKAACDTDAANPGSGEDDGTADDDSTADRGAKPLLIRRRPIGEHTRRELAALARWVESRGSSRTETDVVAELGAELDLLHRGARTDDVLIHAVRVARAGAPELG